MTIRDLIERLQEFDPSTQVFVVSAEDPETMLDIDDIDEYDGMVQIEVS
jgi:hypothetical protein